MSTALRFLVVDDFPTMRRIIRNFLLDLSYANVTEADDGTTALQILKQGMIDFVITDRNMPGMSGLDLLRAVRNDPALSKLPVLLVTAEGRRDHIIEATKAGVNGYVVKPFTAQALNEEINKILASIEP